MKTLERAADKLTNEQVVISICSGCGRGPRQLFREAGTCVEGMKACQRIQEKREARANRT